MHTMLTLHVDELVDLDRDLREDRGDVEDLATSIIELGLLEPLIVVPDDDGRHVIHAGHRRRDAILRACALLAAEPQRFDLDPDTAAARVEALQQVPCFLRPDLAGRDALTQIAENGERRDLTDAERARGLQLALDDGLDVATIARATGIKPATVRAAGKVAALPDSAREALAAGQIGIDDAAQLDEFADDPKALDRILRSSHLAYAIGDERQKRQRTAETAALRQQLTDDGYTLVKKPKDFPYNSREAALRDLTDENGETLTVEAHGKADGHAVYVDAQNYSGPRAVHICCDPEAHGHTRQVRNSYVSPAEAAAREAREQQAREQAERMTVARGVRAKFLRSLIGSQKAAAKHVDLLHGIAARWPGILGDGHRHHLAGQLLGDVDGWTPARLAHRAVTAAVLGIDYTADGVRGWRHDEEPALWWWDQLAALGYDLTPAEIEHRDQQRVSLDARRAGDAARTAALVTGRGAEEPLDEQDGHDETDPDDEAVDQETVDQETVEQHDVEQEDLDQAA
jgi:ParB-like chromosome segregation protein Spo0J